MPLTNGDKLGPYEILAPLGAGGMGEVYKARDTRLDRRVAVKVLPEHIAHGQDARARFEREARAVASLNHPNICTLHDIGPGYMVMELIEGEPLAARIEKGALPLDQALKLATQIADALDRAHRAGVTHRDVKPQNIMLTRDGVKVLDFGLAKSAAAKPGPTEETLTKVLTTDGAVMGTPQHMAPEQFEGKEADARSDIWAFGAVLYEMVTGQKAFQGKSYSSLLGAILSADPPPMSVKPFTPSWLERLVKRCLQKDPDDRYQSMRDVVLDLSTPPQDVESTAPSRSRLGWVAWVVAAVMTLAAVGAFAFAWRAHQPPPTRPMQRFVVDLGENVESVRPGSTFALSPDGSRFVVMERGPKGSLWYTRLLDQPGLTPLPESDPWRFGSDPFFSPDGQWLAYFSPDRKLKKISMQGGAPGVLSNPSPAELGGSWGDDGSMILCLDGVVLSRIRSSGGTPEPVTQLNKAANETAHRLPQILPGGKSVLFTVKTDTAGWDDASIQVQSLTTGQRKILYKGGFHGRYVQSGPASGHLLFVHRSSLYAAPMSLDRLELTADPVQVVDRVSNFLGGGSADYAVAQNGLLAYLPGGSSFEAAVSLEWLDPSGKTAPLLTNDSGALIGLGRISPDGRRLAVATTSETGTSVYAYDVTRETLQRLTFQPGENRTATWFPDGKHLAFSSDQHGGAANIYSLRADGAGQAVRLTESNNQQAYPAVSADGKRMAYVEKGADGHLQIWSVALDISDPEHPRPGKPELFLRSTFDESSAVFSPDGRWLAYQSNESGTYQVYVRPFPGPGGKWQISTAGGVGPAWSRDSRQLFYLDQADNQIMAVSYAGKGDVFEPAKPVPFNAPILAPIRFFDPAPDGKRIAVAFQDIKNVQRQVVFLVNFFDELRRKVPVGK